MGKTKKNNKKGGGIGKSKPEKPHTPPEKTRKNVNFSPSTKSPSSPKQNKTKKMYISRNKERQKAVTKYENRQEQLDLIDMILGKKPLEGGKNKRNRKKRTRRRKRGGDDDANDDANDCPICITEINDDEDDKLTTNCNHSFHTSCFVQNCLAELRKDNFSKRDEENKVFQCPNCRGDTKADCLNNPEVRAIYEGLQLNRNDIGDNDDRLEFQDIGRKKNQSNCTKCNGQIYSTVINFGQFIPTERRDKARKLALKADVCLAIGSTLSINPAAGYCKIIALNHGTLIIINKGLTNLDKLAKFKLEMTIF